MSRGRSLSHGRIAEIMGASQSTLSMPINRVERRPGRDEQSTRLAKALWAAKRQNALSENRPRSKGVRGAGGVVDRTA